MSGALKPMELDLDILSGKLIYIPMPNFNYRMIPEGCYIIIPQYQEMIIHRELIVDGNLVIDGDLAFVE